MGLLTFKIFSGFRNLHLNYVLVLVWIEIFKLENCFLDLFDC